MYPTIQSDTIRRATFPTRVGRRKDPRLQLLPPYLFLIFFSCLEMTSEWLSYLIIHPPLRLMAPLPLPPCYAMLSYHIVSPILSHAYAYSHGLASRDCIEKDPCTFSILESCKLRIMFTLCLQDKNLRKHVGDCVYTYVQDRFPCCAVVIHGCVLV